MNNRRIALGLGTGAGALLGAALLSGLTSPLAAADDLRLCRFLRRLRPSG